MPYNLNMENIIIHNKTRDMLPSISSTILHVRYSEHANSKSVQSSPIWRYKMRREAFKFWDLVCLILETLRYMHCDVEHAGGNCRQPAADST